MQEPWRMSAWSSGAVASNRGDVCLAKAPKGKENGEIFRLKR